LEQIRNQALALSESDRAELARDLLKSLDGPPDPDANNAWDADIERRLKQIDEGTVQPMDREELRRRFRQYSESR
jgi:putative addiction module component (TIGR02574 family)